MKSIVSIDEFSWSEPVSVFNLTVRNVRRTIPSNWGAFKKNIYQELWKLPLLFIHFCSCIIKGRAKQLTLLPFTLITFIIFPGAKINMDMCRNYSQIL